MNAGSPIDEQILFRTRGYNADSSLMEGSLLKSSLQDKQGCTALHRAMMSHCDKALPHLLSMPGGKEAASVPNKALQTALHIAAGQGSLRDISLLLKAYPEAKDLKDRYGRTPLECCHLRQTPNICKVILVSTSRHWNFCCVKGSLLA